MQLDGLRFIRLNKDHVIKPFDCGNSDLNDFFINDSHNFQKDLLAVTYILETDINTVAFFSILNDKISLRDIGNPNTWESKFLSFMPQRKKLKSFPAMKIGRLAVNDKDKGNKIGKTIIDYLKNLFITNNRTRCKFITVDAYSESLKFYEKSGFIYLTEKDLNKDTRAMYFDLKVLIE